MRIIKILIGVILALAAMYSGFWFVIYALVNEFQAIYYLIGFVIFMDLFIAFDDTYEITH